MKTEIEKAIIFLCNLYQSHHQCEDSWYSCPLSEEGCANDNEEGCTCGAEEHNKKLQEAIDILKDLL